MESGQRKDADGKLIPAMHINEVTATLNGKVFDFGVGSFRFQKSFVQFLVKGVKAVTKCRDLERQQRR